MNPVINAVMDAPFRGKRLITPHQGARISWAPLSSRIFNGSQNPLFGLSGTGDRDGDGQRPSSDAQRLRSDCSTSDCSSHNHSRVLRESRNASQSSISA